MAGLDGSVLTTRADATTKAIGKANAAGSSTITHGTSIMSGIITNTGSTTAIMIGTTTTARRNTSVKREKRGLKGKLPSSGEPVQVMFDLAACERSDQHG